MMKTQYLLKYALVSGLLALLLYGCVYSVHPLFRESELVIREDLLGTWRESDDVTWQFTKGNGSYYDVVHISGGDTTQLNAGLGRLGDYYYLDLSLDDAEHLSEMEAVHLFPTHTYSKISFRDNEITMESFGFSANWLENLIKEKRIRIKHEAIEDHVLLTASTSELQKFVLKYSDEPKAFGDPETLTRISSE